MYQCVNVTTNYKIMKKLFSVLILLQLFLGVSFVYAASSTTGIGSAQTNLGSITKDTGLSKDLDVTLGLVIKGALSLVGTIFLVLTVYAGILWMTARGEDSAVEKSQNIIKASIIGLFITLSAYAITYYITNRLAG